MRTIIQLGLMMLMFGSVVLTSTAFADNCVRAICCHSSVA